MSTGSTSNKLGMDSEFTHFTLDHDQAKSILTTEINSREKEIERITRVAEKDKRDAQVLTSKIKDFKEQLNGFIKDFYEPDLRQQQQSPKSGCTTINNQDTNNNDKNNDFMINRKSLIEKSTALVAIEGTISLSPFLNPIQTPPSIPGLSSSTNLFLLSQSPSTQPPTTSSTTSPLSSMSFWDTKQNQQQQQQQQQQNQQQQQHENDKESVSILVSSYQNKDEEFERVKSRATAESMRAQYLKEQYEELSQLVQSEKEYWGRLVDQKGKEVEFKEKEIKRLLKVAESQKQKSKDISDQIARLKKSLATVSQLRSNVDMKTINDKFSFESLSHSPSTVGSSSTSSSTRSYSPSKNLTSPNQQSPKQSKCLTLEKKEIQRLDSLLEKKEEEIQRIRDIIEYETSKSHHLNNKANELKSILEEESKQVESIQNQSIRQIKEKEEAIVKVALRAHKERQKSNQLKDQIKKLNRVLYNDESYSAGKKNRKSPELDSVFMEMGDLKQFQDLSLNQYFDENVLNSYQQQQNSINSSLSPVINIKSTTTSTTPIASYPTGTTPTTSLLSRSPSTTTSNSNSIGQPSISNASPRIILNPQQQIYQPQQVQSHHAHHHHPIPSTTNSSTSSINIPLHHQQHHHHHHHQRRYSTSECIGSPNNIYISKSPKTSMMSPSNSFANGIGGSNSTFVVGSPSEVIISKLKDIERLGKETIQKDHELCQVKKIAEAERSRLSLLKDKFNELRSEYLEREMNIYDKNLATKTF
eukprot:gene4751-5929_t